MRQRWELPQMAWWEHLMLALMPGYWVQDGNYEIFVKTWRGITYVMRERWVK